MVALSLRRRCVDITIDLNHKPRLVTVEVDDKGTEGRLPTELPAAPAIAQLLPQDSFCWGEGLA
jgi:hypothetical protein